MHAIRQRTIKLRAAAWLITGVLCTGIAAAQTRPDTSQIRKLDQLVSDVCDKQVVLLGEDSSHGSGKTLEIKVDIVKKLIEKCDFSAVLFESQIYDFFDFEQSLAEKTATPAQLADAIGGVWSTAKEIDPLIAYLFKAASDGRVNMLGIDPQVGGITQRYTQRHLATRLASSLNGVQRKECEIDTYRLTNWQFDDNMPYDDAARDRLRTCIDGIQSGIAGQRASRSAAVLAIMATNLSRYLDMSSGNSFNLRDRAMYENIVWHRGRLPADAKIIVWCATIHAAKTAASFADGSTPMGSYIHRSLGERAAAIGFTALSGSYGRQGHAPTELEAASEGSLESLVFADSADEVEYVNRKQLDALGTVVARPISYRNPASTNWGEVLDGLIVLRRERPPEYVRAIAPRQADREVRQGPGF